MRHHTVVGRYQHSDFALSAVQPLGDQEPVRQIVHTERERGGASVRLPFRLAAP